MKRPVFGILLTTLLSLPAQGYDWQIPAWAPRPEVPADNPMSEAKVELGRYLFYDTRLSADQSMSCASCHRQERAFTDGRALSPGINGKPGLRSSMTLTNVAYLPVLTWNNPGLHVLEQQALVPLFGDHPIELGMAGKEQLLLQRLQRDSRYPALFKDAFPERRGSIDLTTVTQAIAAFERTLISFSSPYDRYKFQGEQHAISAAAKRGEELFFGERLECYHCHGGLNFTDNHMQAGLSFPETGFHNTGLYNLDGQGRYPRANPGIRELTGSPGDEGKFRTPTLRNIALTAPYMHDGSLPTLRDVILKHYARQGRAVTDGQPPSPLRSPLIAGFEISDREVDDLIAFLHSLTDPVFITARHLADPHAPPAAER